MLTIDEVMDKIDKLLRLSRSSNPHEAALAASKVQVLLFKHNLDLQQVTNRLKREEVTFQDWDLKTNLGNYAWKIQLCAHVARANFSEVLGMRPLGRVRAFGKAHNLKVVWFLFSYLSGEIERLAKEAVEQKQPEKPKSFRRAFGLGAVLVIGKRLQEQQEESVTAEPEARALVLAEDQAVKNAIEKQFPKLKNGKAPRCSNDHGLFAGMRAGRSIKLAQGIEGRI